MFSDFKQYIYNLVAEAIISNKIKMLKNTIRKGSCIAASLTAIACPNYLNAAEISISVGGFVDFQTGFSNQDDRFETSGANTRSFKTQNDTEIFISIEGKSDSGFVYGAVKELNADVSVDADSDGLNGEKTYIYFETPLGRLELGANSGAQTTMNINASSIARATGGINGDWYDFVGVTSLPYITTPELPAAHAAEGGVREDANKLSLYSPELYGVQLGVSYTPDQSNSGTVATFRDFSQDQKDVVGLGAIYSLSYDDINITTSATAELGRSRSDKIFNDTQAWAVGAVVEKNGFSVAGSYSDWNDSESSVDGADSWVWTAGTAYEKGDYGVSLTYLKSNYDNILASTPESNEFQNISLGVDYEVAEGLLPYAEFNLFDMDTIDNQGYTLLLGTQMNF